MTMTWPETGPTVALDDVLEGRGDAVDALARSDGDAWTALLEHVARNPGEDAPPPLIAAMLAREPSFDAWVRRARSAAALIDSPLFTTSAAALRPFMPWLREGFARGAPSGSAAALAARLSALGAQVGPDALDRVRGLVGEVAELTGQEALHGRALLLLARCSLEAGRLDDASDAAALAERLLVDSGSAIDVSRARRLRGAALLRAQRFEEAFAILSPAMSRATLHGTPLALTAATLADPLELALWSLAESALFSSTSSPGWLVWLGAVAELLAGTAAGAIPAERFAHDLSAVARDSDVARAESTLRDVARAARAEGFADVARAADAGRPMRGVVAHGLRGGALILRIATASGAWLRVHDDGSLERAEGDARHDVSRVEIVALGQGDLLARALALRSALCASLDRESLEAPRPGAPGIAVQAFAEEPPFVEGRVSQEVEMGVPTDVIGLRGDARQARACMDTIRALLARA